MLFNSLIFFVFFGAVALLYSIPFGWRLKKAGLLIASYAFYAAWNPPFLILIWISTLVDWFCAGKMSTSSRERTRRYYVITSLCCNLGMLAFFKYGSFLIDNAIFVFEYYSITIAKPQWDIVLPVGISFYTFQTLSYTLDVYRRKIEPSRSLLDFSLFVAFFPQLVAGPIVRARDFLPQLMARGNITLGRIGWGANLFLLGLFEKTVLSDTFLAPVVDTIYNAPASHVEPTMLAAWCATVAFSGQIFCDFAGYSSCAIGIAMCLGFNLPENFHFPYGARGFSDFWRRWHITLSTWLRDYLYISLGGNRRGVVRMLANLMTTMLIGGLWHGAAWTYVVWGGLHGIYLVAERGLRATPLSNWSIWQSLGGRIFVSVLTYVFVCIAWVYFRAPDFTRANDISMALFGMTLSRLDLPSHMYLTTLAIMTVLLITHMVLARTKLESVVQRCPVWAIALVNAFMLVSVIMAAILSPEMGRAFIYFQF